MRRTFNMTDIPDQRLADELRQVVDDSVLTHTGRSIGDIASERVADDILAAVQAARTEWEREADRRTLETIASLLNGDSIQVEVVKGYIRNKLKMRQATAPPDEPTDEWGWPVAPPAD